MPLRLAYLGSGSRGNCAVVEAGETRVMVDCGFSVAETRTRLGRLGLALDDVHAVLVTHEHSDHISGVARVARAGGMPVHMTAGTARVWRDPAVPVLEIVNPHRSFRIGELEIEPVAVPHDAREPCQYVFSHGGQRLGILTDAGHVTPHMRERYASCDLLALECNHDREMLMRGPYPPRLKARVGGDQGHLSNDQAADLLSGVDMGRLQHLVAVHLSEQNNHPERVREAVDDVPGLSQDLVSLAAQDGGLDWVSIA